MADDQGSFGFRLRDLDISRDNGKFELQHSGEVSYFASENSNNCLPVIGKSGCGKSTLLNVLSGTLLPEPSRASVHWFLPNGTDFLISNKAPLSLSNNLQQLRQKYFAYTTQESYLHRFLTVRENLELSLHQLGHSRRKTGQIIDAAIADTFPKGSSILSKFPSSLSGGERQRISLLCAFVKNPYVLFADEPTGNLDAENRGRIMRLLSEWATKGNGKRILIWVTHHPNDPKTYGGGSTLRISKSQIVLAKASSKEVIKQ